MTAEDTRQARRTPHTYLPTGATRHHASPLCGACGLPKGNKVHNDKGPVQVELICEAQEGTDTAEIDRAEWDAMTPTQRAVLVQEMAAEHMNSQGGYGWHIADEADAAVVGDTPDYSSLLAAVEQVIAAGHLDWDGGVDVEGIQGRAHAALVEAYQAVTK